jgi:hypothetical protein
MVGEVLLFNCSLQFNSNDLLTVLASENPPECKKAKSLVSGIMAYLKSLYNRVLKKIKHEVYFSDSFIQRCIFFISDFSEKKGDA